MARRKSSSKSRSRSNSVIPVRDSRGRTIGFRKMVPITRKDGTKSKVTRFLGRSQWPKSESVLRRLKVNESLDEIDELRMKNLQKGQRKRGSKSRKSSSSAQVSRRKRSSNSRKSGRRTRRSKSASPLKSLSSDERAFRSHYARPVTKKTATTKNMRASQMYEIPTAPPIPAGSVSRSKSSSKGAAVRRGGGRRAANRRKSRSWSIAKNRQMEKLMMKEYGRVLTPAEFKALPAEEKRELALQAYEAAFPAKKRASPTRMLSNKAKYERETSREKKRMQMEKQKEKRREKREKKSRSKSSNSTTSRRKKASHSAAPYGPEGEYPGQTQALQDFVKAYHGKSYKSDSARAAAMSRDLNSTSRVVKRSTSYNKWKKEPWKYDLGSIDTKGSNKQLASQFKKGGMLRGMSKAERDQYL